MKAIVGIPTTYIIMKISHDQIKHLLFLHDLGGWTIPKLTHEFNITERGLRKRFAKVRLDKRNKEHRRAYQRKLIRVLDA